MLCNSIKCDKNKLIAFTMCRISSTWQHRHYLKEVVIFFHQNIIMLRLQFDPIHFLIQGPRIFDKLYFVSRLEENNIML